MHEIKVFDKNLHKFHSLQESQYWLKFWPNETHVTFIDYNGKGHILWWEHERKKLALRKKSRSWELKKKKTFFFCSHHRLTTFDKMMIVDQINGIFFFKFLSFQTFCFDFECFIQLHWNRLFNHNYFDGGISSSDPFYQIKCNKFKAIIRLGSKLI